MSVEVGDGGSGAGGVSLTLALRPRIEALMAKLAEGSAESALSDWSFSNLFLFRQAHAWRFVDGPWPHLSGRTYDGMRHVFALFPLHEAPGAALEQLLQGHEGFFPLSAPQARRLDPSVFETVALRDDADYLYPVSHFLHYRGGALRKKRNLVAQLLDAHRVEILPYGPALRAEAEGVLQAWLADKGKTAGDADDGACREALAWAAELGLQGWLLRADSEPAGFVLGQALQPGVDVIRFAKGLGRFKGVPQALFQHYARHRAATAEPPLRWLNFEQDLGLPNFRRTKMSYAPAALLDKHRAWWRHGAPAATGRKTPSGQSA